MDSKQTIRDFPIRRISSDEFPGLLRTIPDPPETIAIRGTLPPAKYILLTVVGSRRFSDYGKEVCEMLIAGLRGLPVVIVSGLALGIDSVAHRAALQNGLLTLAVPGSGLDRDVIYPASHLGLAEEILKAGGALLSPFEDSAGATIWSFPLRNRLMAGMSHATLVIEANIKSGTLITAKHASEFGRDVCTVPGSIFTPQSAGPHMLLRLGATPITTAAELRDALGFTESIEHEPDKLVAESAAVAQDLSPGEKQIIEVLKTPRSREELFICTHAQGLSTAETSILLSILEIKGCVCESMGELRLI